VNEIEGAKIHTFNSSKVLLEQKGTLITKITFTTFNSSKVLLELV